jgi:hypothetical protein
MGSASLQKTQFVGLAPPHAAEADDDPTALTATTAKAANRISFTLDIENNLHRPD